MPFKNSDRSVLEQACERLATMAYEVPTGKMAYGLKSDEYSYGRGKYASHVAFEAIFTPFNDKDENLVIVQFNAVPSHDSESKWCMEDGRVGYKHHYTEHRMCHIGFAEGPMIVISSSHSAIVFAGDGCSRSVADFSVSPEAETSYLSV